MCEEAGATGEKSNHSLRVAGTCALLDAGVPERIIQGRTGHRSLEALRMYERVTDKQEEKVSKILSGSVDKFSVESEPVVPPKPPVYAVPPTLPSTVNHPPSVAQPIAGSHYYNCTVNMYEMPKQSSPLLGYFPS